ncbi:hypothetical protein HDU96_005463 [Phlyctochytrium bullatum]|nr:hypothetical protein HDU96_005463 [Phlyctochytrium bullatum]
MAAAPNSERATFAAPSTLNLGASFLNACMEGNPPLIPLGSFLDIATTIEQDTTGEPREALTLTFQPALTSFRTLVLFYLHVLGKLPTANISMAFGSINLVMGALTPAVFCHNEEQVRISEEITQRMRQSIPTFSFKILRSTSFEGPPLTAFSMPPPMAPMFAGYGFNPVAMASAPLPVIANPMPPVPLGSSPTPVISHANMSAASISPNISVSPNPSMPLIAPSPLVPFGASAAMSTIGSPLGSPAFSIDMAGGGTKPASFNPSISSEILSPSVKGDQVALLIAKTHITGNAIDSLAEQIKGLSLKMLPEKEAYRAILKLDEAAGRPAPAEPPPPRRSATVSSSVTGAASPSSTILTTPAPAMLSTQEVSITLADIIASVSAPSAEGEVGQASIDDVVGAVLGVGGFMTSAHRSHSPTSATGTDVSGTGSDAGGQAGGQGSGGQGAAAAPARPIKSQTDSLNPPHTIFPFAKQPQDDKMKRALDTLDRANRLTSEVASVVTTLMGHVERGSKSKKRGRADISAQEDYGPPTPFKVFPEGMVGLLPSTGISDPQSISRLHALIQALRHSSVLDRLLKHPEQDDAHPLGQQLRLLLSSMKSLSLLNPTCVRPTSLHSRLADLLNDRLSPASLPASSSDQLSLLLQHILHPGSYEFHERWQTPCPHCKTEVLSSPTTLHIFEVPVLAPSDPVELQTLIDLRMMGRQVPFRCPNFQCPQNQLQSLNVLSRPQLPAKLPSLLFVHLLRDTELQITGKPLHVRVSCPLRGALTLTSNSDFHLPHQFRIVAGLVRDPKTHEYMMIRQMTAQNRGGNGMEGFGAGERWIRCRNEKVDEVEALSEYEERGLEILVCENLAPES